MIEKDYQQLETTIKKATSELTPLLSELVGLVLSSKEIVPNDSRSVELRKQMYGQLCQIASEVKAVFPQSKDFNARYMKFGVFTDQLSKKAASHFYSKGKDETTALELSTKRELSPETMNSVIERLQSLDLDPD